jgi:ribosomal protein S1
LLSTGRACCCTYSVSYWFQIVEASGASNLEWTESLAIGTCVEGEIQEIKDYGVIVNVPKHKDIVGFVTHYQCMSIMECKTLIHTSPFPPVLKVV